MSRFLQVPDIMIGSGPNRCQCLTTKGTQCMIETNTIFENGIYKCKQYHFGDNKCKVIQGLNKPSSDISDKISVNIKPDVTEVKKVVPIKKKMVTINGKLMMVDIPITSKVSEVSEVPKVSSSKQIPTINPIIIKKPITHTPIQVPVPVPVPIRVPIQIRVPVRVRVPLEVPVRVQVPTKIFEKCSSKDCNYPCVYQTNMCIVHTLS